jgi:hypothetical protein
MPVWRASPRLIADQDDSGLEVTMDQSFSEVVADWRDFYTFTGTVGATLLGLLFVSVSLRLNLFREREVADIRAGAVHTFANFLYLILIALLFVIPGQQPAGVGLPLAFFGLSGFGWIIHLVKVRKDLPVSARGVGSELWFWQGYLGLSIATYVGLIVVAIRVMNGFSESLYWLVVVNVALLMMATLMAWLFLSHARSS